MNEKEDEKSSLIVMSGDKRVNSSRKIGHGGNEIGNPLSVHFISTLFNLQSSLFQFHYLLMPLLLLLLAAL